MLAWLQILRFPNIFTLCADVVLAWFLVQRAFPVSGLPGFFPAFCTAGVAAGLLYWAGMVLNDVHDFEEDTHLRPERPIPSGKISRSTARRAGWTLWGLGLIGMVGASWYSLSGFWTAVFAGILALAVLAYNTSIKDTPFGPVLMGFCRGWNLFTMMSFAPMALWTSTVLTIVPMAIGVYICGVTFYSRGETEAAVGTSFAEKLFPVLGMTLGIGILWNFVAWLPELWVEPLLLKSEPWRWQALVGLLMAWIFFRSLNATLAGPQSVRRMMKPAIFTLFVLDAAVVFTVAGIGPACWILGLLVPATVSGWAIASS